MSFSPAKQEKEFKNANDLVRRKHLNVEEQQGQTLKDEEIQDRKILRIKRTEEETKQISLSENEESTHEGTHLFKFKLAGPLPTLAREITENKSTKPLIKFEFKPVTELKIQSDAGLLKKLEEEKTKPISLNLFDKTEAELKTAAATYNPFLIKPNKPTSLVD